MAYWKHRFNSVLSTCSSSLQGTQISATTNSTSINYVPVIEYIVSLGTCTDQLLLVCRANKRIGLEKTPSSIELTTWKRPVMTFTCQRLQPVWAITVKSQSILAYCSNPCEKQKTAQQFLHSKVTKLGNLGNSWHFRWFNQFKKGIAMS